MPCHLSPSTRSTCLAAGAVAMLAILTFSSTLAGSFIWDDHAYIVGNEHLVGLAGLRAIWLSLDQPDYWPVSSSALWLLRQAAGLEPWAYHFAQVLLHATAAVLAGWALLELHWRGAWLAAAIWAVHPLHVQVVAWPYQIKTTLAACFYFAAVAAFARWRRDGGRWVYALSLLGFVLAVLSKTQSVMLPVVLIGMAWWVDPREGVAPAPQGLPRRVAAVAPFFAVALAAGSLTVFMQHRAATIDATLGMGVVGRLAAMGHAALFYLRQAMWPTHLAAVYPRWDFDPQAWISLWATAVVTLGIVVLASVGSRGRLLLAGVLFFLVNLLPVLGWVDFQFMTLSPVADHFAYIALLGLAAAVGAMLSRRGKPGAVAAGAIVILLAVLSVQRAGAYRRDETLWRDTIARQPMVWVGYHNLALVRQRQDLWDEAAALSEQAWALRPDRPDVRLTLGDARMRQGRYADALVEYEAARSGLPDWPLAALRVGDAKQALGDREGAIRAYREALTLRPNWPAADQRLSEALGLQ